MTAALSAVGDCDVFFSVGTSSLVWPAAGFAEMAKQHRATVIEVNPDATGIAEICDYRLAANSGAVLPELIDCLTG